MPVISGADAPSFELPGVLFTGLAAPSRGAKESSAWLVTLKPGAEGTPHQMTREEIFVAIDGKAQVMLDGSRCNLEKGSALVVPAHTDFSLSNPYDQPFRAVAMMPVGGEAVMGNDSFVPKWAL